MTSTPPTSTSPLGLDKAPDHVAIIMDGNGRWAQERGRSRLDGHQAGTENIRRVIETFQDFQVPYLTLYAFSTENWGRPEAEVNALMAILAEVIDREIPELHRRGVRIRHLGREEGWSRGLREKVRAAVELTSGNLSLTVSIAFNYGGRAEILDAVRDLIAAGVRPEGLDEALFGRFLYSDGIPDPDLLIRTAGEMRLSNFLIWQAAYSEYYATPTYWPDFGREEIERALLAYSQRRRRFGGLDPG